MGDCGFVGTGFCKNRADFIHLLIVYRISDIIELNDLWKKAESYNQNAKKELHDTVVGTILSDFKDKSIFETAKTVMDKFGKNDG